MSFIYPGGDEQVTPNIGLATWGMDEVLAQNMILIDSAITGSGSIVKVNGVTELLANFNDSTPAAPGGGTNVKWQVDGSGNVSAYVAISGAGTVTSVAMTGDGVIFNSTVTGSPITTSGTLVPALLTQVANRVLAGPTSGGAATPTFRALVSGDIPALAYVTSVGLTMPAIFSVANSPITSSGTLAVTLATETANTVWAGPTTGIAATPSFRALVTADLPAGTGTVTSVTFTGDGTVLSSTPSSAVTTSGTLQAALANAAGGTVLGRAGATTGAPAYTIAPHLGIPGTSTGSIALASSTASGLFTITAPADASTPTLTLPTTSNVLAGQLVGDGTIFSTSIVQASAAGTLTLPTPSNQTANTVFAGPASGGAAAPTFRALVTADIPSGIVTWDRIGSALGNLTLNNAGFTSTFNQTSGVAWSWLNTTPTVTGAVTTLAISTSTGPTNVSGNTWRFTFAASESGAGSNAWVNASVTVSGYTGGAVGNNGTFVITASTTTTFDVVNASGTTTRTGTPVMISSAVVSSPSINLSGTINSGVAGTLNSIADTWTIQVNPGSVAPNPVSFLSFTHSGTTGVAALAIPNTTGSPTLTFNSNQGGVGYIANAGTSLHNASGTSGLSRLYAGATFQGLIYTGGGTGNMFGLMVNTANVPTILCGNTTTGVANSSAVLISNILQGTGVVNLAATSGTQVFLQILGTSFTPGNASTGTPQFAPSSGTANFIATLINPTINQTATASGNYTGLLVNIVETSLKGTDNRLLDLQAGASGGTSEFTITNTGIVKTYNAIATVSNGIPSELAVSDLTAQSAAKTATTLYAATVTGMYRVSWSATITTAATTSSVLGGTNGFQVLYTSPTDSVVKTTVAGASITSAANTTGTATTGAIVVYAKTGTNIQFTYDYTSVGVTAMVYELHIKVEAM